LEKILLIYGKVVKNLKRININTSIFEIIKDNPEVMDIMKELGFEDISKPAVLNTAGRVMTLPKGAALRGIDMEKIKKAFLDKGFEIIE
jgi:hypothetical protein